ncbi:metabotropic glycine receptor-like, partial [Ruditapes philippinarum]|uniref:metabotropic glycine receptor-like n=1 Tax=Ruditapes philippinarum TaxID=129788 RepID=UPI00295B20C0
YRGVVVLDIDLKKPSVNQCDDSESIFSGSHKCRPETTKCKFIPDGGLQAGQYECHCKSGFYFPLLNATQKFYTGTQVERHILQSMRSDANFSTSDFQCLPCRQGCIDCDDDGPCLVEYNILMRGIPLGIQSFCMTITLVLGIVVLRVRKCKVMVIGMWCLLEIILLGALFLYATGKQLLADFQSRKAHRVHVRDKDLLKYLLCIVVVVIGYMAAWTAVNIDQVQEGVSLIERRKTSDEELSYFICKSGWWDYSTEVAEVLFLVFGIYLCYRVRAAPSEYCEGTYVSAAICYECFISTVFYVLRHIYWLSLHPDYLFLMYFLRCQLTVSVTLVLVFGSKLWYAHRPPDERQIRNRAYSSSDVPDNMAPEVMKLNVGISSNGDVDVGDVSLADMDPEDIRAELKRLYTQLQVYKTRNMRKDNPHISKRRGGRKQTHRRFSLQAFHHKHRHHHTEHTEHEHEMSRTPEESTNSAEGLPMPIEMSVTKCEEVNENKPTSSVSFKMYHTHK